MESGPFAWTALRWQRHSQHRLPLEYKAPPEYGTKRKMFHVAAQSPAGKSELYTALREQLASLLEGERDSVANAANMASLLYHALPDVNWAGFYFFQGRELVLGPFQGKPACVRIPIGSGVCGTAAGRRESLVVPDVNLFPGHIACDSASRSELVVPLIRDGVLLGVLDMDSPTPGRFDDADRLGAETLAAVYVEAIGAGA